MHIKWPKVKTFIEIFKESDLDLDEILNLKNMENNYGTPFALMMQSESISDAYDNLIYYMKINNLIINYENEINDFKDIKSRLVFEEKENLISKEKSEWNEYFIERQAKLIKRQSEFINMMLNGLEKDKKKVHIPTFEEFKSNFESSVEHDIKMCMEYNIIINSYRKYIEEVLKELHGTK